MDAIVYRDGFRCKRAVSGWKVSVWESKGVTPPSGFEGLTAPLGGWVGTGQRELTITPRVVYSQLSEHRELFDACNPFTGEEWGVDVNLDDLHDKALQNARRSAGRAKRKCRQKIKSYGFSQLLTFTYRENMTDFDRCRRDIAATIRRLRVAIPGFRAVYAFETQKRGAWHCHMAVDRLPFLLVLGGVKVKSFDAARAIWRSVVGANNGTVNVDGHRSKSKQHQSARKGSLAKMAGYVAKYLTKDIENGSMLGRHMWSSTQGLTVPKVIRFDLPDCSIEEAISAAFELLPGHRIAVHRIGRDGDSWCLYTEPE